MKRHKPLKRGRRVKPANGARKANAFARNYGPEADALRSLPCVVASYGNGRHRCSPGPIEVAHVVARGMGGAKGGRFDIVPLCSKAHANASEEGTTRRQVFELAFDVDLRAEADRLALEHERPLGLRGVGDRWAIVVGNLRGEAIISPYELDALGSWVGRELAREVERRRVCSDELDAVLGWTSEQASAEFIFDREALAHHIAHLLGGAFETGTQGEHVMAWSLCEWATEGRWVS